MNFTPSLMPRKSHKILTVFVKEKGCPLHPVQVYDHSNNSYDGLMGNPLTVFPALNPDPAIYNDTVCNGDGAVIKVYSPLPNYNLQELGSNYQWLYDGGFQMLNSAGVVVATASTVWGQALHGNILIFSQIAPSLLSPGRNTFLMQEQSGNCPWQNLSDSAKVLVNMPPNQTLTVQGQSQCMGNGTAKILNSQNNVYYTPSIGSSTVGSTQDGNNGTLTFNINGTFLNAGTNSVSFSAVIAGCPAVSLNNKATIQVVGSPPAVPSTPVGPTNVCSGESNVLYSVTL